MALVTLVPFIVLAFTFRISQSSTIREYDGSCVNDTFLYSSSSCAVYPHDETAIQDVFVAILTKNSLIYTYVTMRTHTEMSKSLMTDSPVQPSHWLIAATTLGRQFLAIKLYIDSLFLTTLLFSVKNANVALLESPAGCLSNKTTEEYEIIIRRLYFCGLNPSFASDYETKVENNLFVCSLDRGISVCCHKMGDAILCSKVEDDYIKLLFKYLYGIAFILIGTVVCPNLVIIIIDMTIPETKEFTVIDIAKDNKKITKSSSPESDDDKSEHNKEITICSSPESDDKDEVVSKFKFRPGALVSSAEDIYSLKGIIMLFFDFKIPFPMIRRFVHKDNVNLIVMLFIILFGIAMVAHFSNDLYYLDTTLYVVLICIMGSFGVRFLLWLVLLLVPQIRKFKENHNEIMNELKRKYMYRKMNTKTKILLHYITALPLISIVVNYIEVISRRKLGQSRWVWVYTIISTLSYLLMYIFYIYLVLGILFDLSLFFIIVFVNPGTVIESLYVSVPLFILTYGSLCFSIAYEDSKKFYGVVFKHVHSRIDEKIKDNMQNDSCFKFSEDNIPVFFFDKIGKPSISRCLILDACTMDCYICPGSHRKRFVDVIIFFLCSLFVFGIVVASMKAFGDFYQISDRVQFLGTLVGGFFPLIYRFLTKRSKLSFYNNYQFSLASFEKKLNEMLKSHKVKDIEKKEDINNSKTDGNGSKTDSDQLI